MRCLLLLLWACAAPPAPGLPQNATTAPAADTAAPQDPDAGLVALAPGRLLRRISLDLRGVLPTLGELSAVEADPDAIEVYTEQWLAEAALEARLVALLAERFKTRLDTFQVGAIDYGLAPEEQCALARDVGEEPLRLMANIVVEDRPWTDVLTAEHTMATPLLEEVWPLERTGPGEGWLPAHYTDDRPAAGILHTNGLWWRYVTSRSNANRSRAAAISDLVLCSDILGRPVSFASAPVLDSDSSTAQTLRENDACAACHATVEPLAASLFGFYPAIDYNPVELGTYHPEREALGPMLLEVSPAAWGTPISGLNELGPVLAQDPRVHACATRTFAELLWRRPSTPADLPRLHKLGAAFADGGHRVRPLLQAIVQDPVYTAGDATGPAAHSQEGSLRLMGPDLMGAVVADLTGFVWELDGCDQLENDITGVRTLAGGVDGQSVTEPQRAPGLTWALVAERLAEGAAWAVVEHDLAQPQAARLLPGLQVDLRPGDPAFDALHRDLHLRLFSADPTDARLAQEQALWHQLDDLAGPTEAWVGLVSVLLRDPSFLTR